MTSQSKNNRLLPLTVIEAAAGGDVEAINAVLKHYAGYIARLSMRELYDEYGNPHLCVYFCIPEPLFMMTNCSPTISDNFKGCIS